MNTNGALLWKVQKFVSKDDYLYAVVKEHPKATKYGYVLAHRIVMENHLNRLLNSNEVVHHINGNKKDNRIENLELMSASEHSSHHGSLVGHSMVKLKCPNCSSIFTLRKTQSFLSKKTTDCNCCSPKCRGQFSRKKQLYGVTQEMKKAISENLLSEFNSLDNSEATALQQEP